jgi:hypothetical protein
MNTLVPTPHTTVTGNYAIMAKSEYTTIKPSQGTHPTTTPLVV